jgi:putative phage-type endonuclease
MTQIGSAVELLPYGSDVTDREQWLELRRQGITASEIAAILGLSHYSSPSALYYAKRDGSDGYHDNDTMAIGRALEPYVLERFAASTRLPLAYCGLVASLDRPWQLATPDAVTEEIVPVEAKTTAYGREWGPQGSSRVPLRYLCQLLWQMDVLGADYGYLAVVIRSTGEFRWYRLGWQDEDILLMRSEAERFMWLIDTGQPPEVDDLPVTTLALREHYAADGSAATCGAALIRSYRAALKARKAAESRLRLAENRIRATMGAASRLTGPQGEEVAVRRIYERAGYEVKATTIDALYAGKGMKDGD